MHLREQYQPRLARARSVAGNEVGVMGNLVVRRPVVGCIVAWLGLSVSSKVRSACRTNLCLLGCFVSAVRADHFYRHAPADNKEWDANNSADDGKTE